MQTVAVGITSFHGSIGSNLYVVSFVIVVHAKCSGVAFHSNRDSQ